jgi:sugar phosphate isomerase/epimerase
MLEICSLPTHLDYHDRAGVEEAGALMNDLGMEAYSFHAPFAEDIDITALNDDLRKHALEEIVLAAEAAAVMKVRYFVIHPGPEKSMNPGPEERLQRMENAAAVLSRVSRRCAELGIGLVLENMLPHLLFGNTRDMLWIMGAIEELRVGTCLDTGHAFLSGDIESVMYKLSGHLQLLHASDTRGTYDDHLNQVATYFEMLKEAGHCPERAQIVRVGRNEMEGFEVTVVGNIPVRVKLFERCRDIYELQKELKR